MRNKSKFKVNKMNDDMKDFVGYRKARTPTVSQTPIFSWGNSMESAVFILNTSIVLLGVVIAISLSEYTGTSDGSSIISFFGKC